MITWFQMRNNKFHSLTTSFENVVIDVGGAQDYVPVVDEKKKADQGGVSCSENNTGMDKWSCLFVITARFMMELKLPRRVAAFPLSFYIRVVTQWVCGIF
jgi:hypothetical protein